MAWGTMGVDFETRVDYDRLRHERLKKTKAELEKTDIGCLLCFDPNNIRYITGAHIGEWARDKMQRYCVLPRNTEPLLFDSGSAATARKLYSPWLKGRVFNAVPWQRGSVPQTPETALKTAKTIKRIMEENGVADKAIGLDIFDVPLLKALQAEGLEIADGHEVMLNARLIKTKDEIQLLKAACAMVDGAYDALVRTIRPGIRENEIVAVAAETLYRLGSDDVECVNVVSGSRTHPHPHVFSDRIVRPGDFVFIDIMHSFNGYRTCYYRTFICGDKPTKEQEEAYAKAYRWLYDAINIVKPGVTTTDIVNVWPSAEAWGLTSEAEARGLCIGHGLGLSIHEKPIISKLFSLDKPFTIQEGMVFALETYANTPDKKHGARIEEMILVTADGAEVLTKYPCKKLIICGMPNY